MLVFSRLRAVCLVAGAAFLALTLQQPAEAGFSSQLVPIAGPVAGGNSGLRDIAVSASGEALVAWTEGGSNDVAVKARRIHPDGSLGAALEVTDGTTRATGPLVDFAPNGRAIVAWIESAKFGDPQSVRARWIEPAGTMTEPITVRTGGALSEPGEMDLAATADDGAILAWHNFKSSPFRIVEAQYVTAGGAVSELILPTSGAGSTHVQVAPNSTAGSLLTWRDSGVRVQAFSPSGAPEPVQTPGPGVISDPDLAGDRHDHFQLVYKVGSLPSALVYNAVAADGSFSPFQVLDPTAAEQIFGFSVATNSANRSIVGWDRVGEGQTVRMRFIANDGSPEPTTYSIPAGPGVSASPSAGIGGLGGAAAAWTQTPSSETGEVLGRIFPATGPPEAPVLISTRAGVAGRPQVAVGDGEVGVAAWDERLPSEAPEPRFLIYARQIMPPPSCPDAAGTIVQGRPTRIDLHCTGLQLLAPTILAQPSHGRLSDLDAAGQSVLYTPTPGFAGNDSFLFAGANRGGTGPTRTARLQVGRDTVPPRVELFKISNRRISAGASASAKRAKAVFRLRYSEVATATITIERRRRCARARGSKRSCKRFSRLGTLSAGNAAVSAKVPLGRRVGGKRLRPGRYRATAIAKDLAGNRSKPRRLRFVVTRRGR